MKINGAADSYKVNKLRKKLEKIIDAERKQTTPESLKEMSKDIHSWINRHEEERFDVTVTVKDRLGRVTKEAKIAEPKDKQVIEKMKQVSKLFEKEGPSRGNLKGRVTS